MVRILNNLLLNQILILSLLFMLSTSSNEDKNEITIIINATKSSEIINSRYNNNISKVIVNGEESNINEYKNYLKSGENEITIVFRNKLNSCEYMFEYKFNNLSNIIKISLKNIDLSEVKNMGSMFHCCYYLLSLDLSNVNTSSVTNMREMFYHCDRIKSLDLSHLDTSSVTNMGEMFYYCDSLVSLDLSHFNTSSVTNMERMFISCHSLVSLDLSHFDTSSVTNMERMFYYCESLISLNLRNINTSSVRNMAYMFYGCFKLVSLDLSNFDTSLVTNMRYMFHDCESLKYLDISSFNTSSVKDMELMFYRCILLTSLNLRHFNTSSVTNMHKMFQRCFGLVSLDISSFNTSSITNMGWLFQYCEKLQSLDLSNFDTSLVTNMEAIFFDCMSLSSLNIRSFNTSSVKIMAYMFHNCEVLTSLYISNFDTSSVTNMAYMFYNCHSLTSLKIEELNLSKLNNTDNMFYQCTSLKYLNLTNFYSDINTYARMFSNCNSDLIYCIDDTKEYQFLSELKNYRKSCSDMCTKYYSKKYIKESNSCIDSCSTEIIYKYDFNNICLEKCPNNTILSDDNITCNSIEDNKSDKNNKKKIILGITIPVAIIVLVAIIIFIIKCPDKINCCKKNQHLNDSDITNSTGGSSSSINKVKIIFIFNKDKTEISKSPQTSMKDLIDSYLKIKPMQNKDKIIFKFNGDRYKYEDVINNNNEISSVFPVNVNDIEILVERIDNKDEEKIKIIFNYNQVKNVIFVSPKTQIKKLIDLYLTRKQFQSEIYFLFDGKSMTCDEAINNNDEISTIIPNGTKEKEILVYDLRTQSTQN